MIDELGAIWLLNRSFPSATQLKSGCPAVLGVPCRVSPSLKSLTLVKRAVRTSSGTSGGETAGPPSVGLAEKSMVSDHNCVRVGFLSHSPRS